MCESLTQRVISDGVILKLEVPSPAVASEAAAVEGAAVEGAPAVEAAAVEGAPAVEGEAVEGATAAGPAPSSLSLCLVVSECGVMPPLFLDGHLAQVLSRAMALVTTSHCTSFRGPSNM